jgi:hypothetical protein
MLAVPVFEHPVAVTVPVTVYVVVVNGLAITVAPELIFNPMAGDHVYELGEMVELAVKLTFPPTQIESLTGALMVGLGFTVITN